MEDWDENGFIKHIDDIPDINTVIIQEGVTKIVMAAFWGFTALESVIIPATVGSIEPGAFSGCTALSEVRFLSENPPVISAVGAPPFWNTAAGAVADVPSSWRLVNGTEWGGLIIKTERIHISVTQDNGKQWIEILGLSADSVYTRGLFLTDSEDLYKWKMPAAIIRPGQSIIISGENTDAVLKRWKINFSMEGIPQLGLIC
jgi:hypothetical protein